LESAASEGHRRCGDKGTSAVGGGDGGGLFRKAPSGLTVAGLGGDQVRLLRTSVDYKLVVGRRIRKKNCCQNADHVRGKLMFVTKKGRIMRQSK
jgi:hypothetical protein